MADENLETTPGATGAESATAPSVEEVRAEAERQKKRANDAHMLLRKKDREVLDLQNQVADIQRQLGERKPAAAAVAAGPGPGGEDPEPNFDEDPGGWFKWNRREDQRLRQRDAQQQEMLNLNAFAVQAETVAKQQVPEYDRAMEWLRTDYRRELEKTGELDEAAMMLMADPGQKNNVTNYALQNGLSSDLEAAREMAAIGAWEWRRQRIVAAQRRRGGNPALTALELAKDRGWNPAKDGKTAAGAPVVEDALKELERRKNLRGGTETTADVREGGESREKRAWTHEALMALRQSNPKEFQRVTAEIARDADDNSLSLKDIIKH